jgi:antitoxin (DNA-binding transcriptional repressor) of toxin-antitoxin stability system
MVEKAAQGESVVIAKAGKSMVRIVVVDVQVPVKKRIGFLAGQVTVPGARAFNDLGSKEIATMFGGNKRRSRASPC